MMIFMVVSGFYVNISTMPLVLKILSFTSPFRFSFEALCINEFDNDDRRNPGEFDILKYLDFELGKWTCLIWLVVLSIILRIVAFFALKRLTGRFA
jgi:hypothetical protein